MRSRLRVALVLVGALGLAAVLRPFPSQFKFRHGGDAVRYLNWSTLISKEGPTVFPSLVREYRQKWIGFPPPTRMFYLGTAALLTRVWRAPGDVYHPLVLISWLSGVAVLLAVAYWMRRDFPSITIVAALLLVAAAPVPRAVSHFPLPDSLLALENVWLFALVVEEERQPRRWLPWLIGFVALLMLLTRETGLFALVAVGVYVLYRWRRTGRFAWPTAIAIVAACLVATALVVLVAGGPRPFWEFVVDDVKAATTTTGSLPFVSGPPYTYFVSFMIVMPLVMVTTIASAPVVARDAATRTAVIPIAILFGVELFIYCFFTKTLRYTIPCEIGIRMVCAVGVGLAWQRRRAFGVALLVALLAVDEGLFLPLFGFDQVYDPTVWAMARQLHMIPW
jgi:hypothetical protein